MKTREWWETFAAWAAGIVLVWGYVVLETKLINTINQESIIALTLFFGSIGASLIAIAVFGLTLWLVVSLFDTKETKS